MIVSTNHLESAAHLCVSLQAPFGSVRNVIDQLQIRPTISINGIEHYAAEDCERIADAIRTATSPKEK